MAPFTVALIDYDDDLFEPPGWIPGDFRRAGIRWVAGQHREPGPALAAAREGDVVIIQSLRPLLARAAIQQLARCRCIVRLGIGYDSVDVEAATQEGIIVCNTPAYCIDDVADHALALLLGAARHLSRQDRWIRAGKWDRTAARPARRLRGCTLGLVGFGRIARAVARRVSGFDLNLLAYDPFVEAGSMAALGVQKADLDELLVRSDFVSIHCPLTRDTHHLLNARAFELMKDGVFLVNTSRGPIIDESALVQALVQGKVWGAGLDVFVQEPLPPGSPLREFDNLILTPHVGANSEESRDDLYRAGYQIAVDVQQGRWPQSVVNPEVRGRTRFPFQ
jgi:D-3-phosphoglycerate dehydrogenase